MPDEPEDGFVGEYIAFAHAEAIGHVVAEMARLELDVDGIIWILAELEEEIGACFTAQLIQIRQKFDALLALAKLRKTSVSGVKKIAKFRDLVISLAERRNRCVHDTWHYGFDSKQHYQLEMTARSELRYLYKPVAEDDLKKLREDIKQARGQFRAVFHEALVTVQPWREKPE